MLLSGSCLPLDGFLLDALLLLLLLSLLLLLLLLLCILGERWRLGMRLG